MNYIDPNRTITCLITGSTDGIGKYTSQLFAEGGFHVIVHGKDEHKINHWVEQLKKTTTNQNIQGICADLSCFEALYKLYQWFKSQKIIEIKENREVMLQSQQGENIVLQEIDKIVLTAGMKSGNTLYRQLEGKISCTLIGDAVKPSKAQQAIKTGYEIKNYIV